MKNFWIIKLIIKKSYLSIWYSCLIGFVSSLLLRSYSQQFTGGCSLPPIWPAPVSDSCLPQIISNFTPAKNNTSILCGAFLTGFILEHNSSLSHIILRVKTKTFLKLVNKMEQLVGMLKPKKKRKQIRIIIAPLWLQCFSAQFTFQDIFHFLVRGWFGGGGGGGNHKQLSEKAAVAFSSKLPFSPS